MNAIPISSLGNDIGLMLPEDPIVDFFKTRDWDNRIAVASHRGVFFDFDKEHAEKTQTGALGETFMLANYSSENTIKGKSGKEYTLENTTKEQAQAITLDEEFVKNVHSDDYRGAEKTLREMRMLLKQGVWFP